MSVQDDLEGAAGPSLEARPWSDDAALVALVLAGFVSARVLHGVSLILPLGFLAFGVASIRPRLAVIGLLLAVAWHAGHDLGALTPAATGPLSDTSVELVSDPEERAGQVRAEVDVDGQRHLLTARASTSRELRSAATGDRFVVSGTRTAWPPDTDWQVSRRLVGRISASEIQLAGRARGPTRAANEMRGLLRRGTNHLSPERQVLFTGLVFGDDRGQSVITSDNFRASGLGHLLAVSGQNVVFVLLLIAPLIGRISSVWLRVAGSMVALVGFGFLTRFEPSVSRALVMAGLALLAHASGRPGAAPLLLPPAVLGLLLVDPLLAWSVGFQLSVAATLGMVIVTPRIAAALPGPRFLVLAGSATLGAQLAVSPLLVVYFGVVSPVAVPANLLAGPAAAAVMMWGLVAGSVAGLTTPEVAQVLHLPTRMLLWWIDGVASVFARAQVGHFGGVQVAASISCLAVLAMSRVPASAAHSRGPRVLAAGGLALLCVSIVAPRPLAPGHHQLAGSVEVVRGAAGHDVVIVDGSANPEELLQVIRSARLGRIDLVIARDGTRATGRLVRLLHRRFDVGDTWAPHGHQVPGARALEPIRGMVGTLVIESDPATNELIVRETALPDRNESAAMPVRQPDGPIR